MCLVFCELHQVWFDVDPRGRPLHPASEHAHLIRLLFVCLDPFAGQCFPQAGPTDRLGL